MIINVNGFEIEIVDFNYQPKEENVGIMQDFYFVETFVILEGNNTHKKIIDFANSNGYEKQIELLNIDDNNFDILCDIEIKKYVKNCQEI